MSSEIKADKWSPASGTSATIGDSGDTYTVPSGVTLDVASGATADFTGATVTGLTDTNTLVKISEANVTSNVGSYFFSNVFSSTYDSYFLDLRKVRFAVDAGLQLRFLSNSGTGEFSGAYYQFAYYGLDNAGNEERDTGNGDTKFVLGPATDADSSSDGGITGNMYFYNPFANNSSSVNAVGQFAYRDASNAFNGINFAGNYSGTAARYGFVLYGGQQINQLQATLYGIVK